MYWAIGIFLYITVGCNLAYLMQEEEDIGQLIIIVIWPLIASGISLYFVYHILTLPARLYKNWKTNKANDKRFWKWKKVGYDKESNQIVRLK